MLYSISREQERRGRLCNEVCKQGRCSIRNGVGRDELSILVMMPFIVEAGMTEFIDINARGKTCEVSIRSIDSDCRSIT